ncbi:amidohydrolase family protein [Aspergillus undulatus]|uniref:amidohydrolase family protein n=1 Tax=Aspergillus undulatus TaxID=1810928 RepID=UPI003CCCD117
MAPLRIDTHHHVFPPLVKKAIENAPNLAQGLPPAAWSPEIALNFMSRNGIEASILSCPMPLSVVTQSASETASLAREVNEYLASIRDKYPKQFGLFAALPSIEDTELCIEEIRYALDVLKADGVGLFTSYNEKYLGHPDFEPIWRELNARKAVVFTHPTMEDIKNSIDEPFTIPRPLVDWTHETTRAAVHLILTNTLRRCAADCRIILSHGGGTLPFVAERVADLDMATHASGKSPQEILNEARSFYFDLALVRGAAPLHLAFEFAADGHVLFGTDYPCLREDTVAKQCGALKDETFLDSTRKAAETLFPRLAE